MIIHTKRLILRPITLNDLETTYKYQSDIKYITYMLYLPKLKKEETYKSLLDSVYNWENNNPKNYEFAVTLNNIHIGEIGLYIRDNETVELGWLLDNSYRGNGYVTEAALEIINLAKKLNYKKVIAHVDSLNTPSYKVMEKLGMIMVSKGIRKNRLATSTSIELLYELNL